MTKLMTFVVFEPFGFLDVVGPGDVFTIANQRAGKKLYELRVAGLERRAYATSESGMRIGIDGDLASVERTHTLLVSGGDGVPAAVRNKDMIEQVRRLSKKSHRVVSICTGAFLLAEAGLLNNRRATTHWAYADDLQRRYPEINVVSDELFVASGKYITAAGIASGIDMALHIVASDHGEELARRTSQRMVLYLNRAGGQSQFSERLYTHSMPADRFEHLLISIAADPTGNLNNAALAERASVSERHLARLFRERTGTTPARWLERVRVDVARKYLENTYDSLADVASQSGFNSLETFRQSFSRIMNMTPAQYRKLHSAGSSR